MTNTTQVTSINAEQGSAAGRHDATPLRVVGIDRSVTLTLVKFQTATGARFGIPLAAALNDPDLLAQLSAADQRRLGVYQADATRRTLFAAQHRLTTVSIDAVDDRAIRPAGRHALRSEASRSPSPTTGEPGDER